VVQLDELVDVVPGAEGVGELVDEHTLRTGAEAAGAGGRGAPGAVRPGAERTDGAAGGALEVEAGRGVHGYSRTVEGGIRNVRERVRLAPVDLRHGVGAV